jgi:hypothetical protein
MKDNHYESGYVICNLWFLQEEVVILAIDLSRARPGFRQAPSR